MSQSSTSDEETPDFPHPFKVLDYGDDDCARPLTLTELRMMDLSYTLRSKSSWWTKYKDPEIRAKWRSEALEQEVRGDKLSEEEVDYVLEELKYFDGMRDEEAGVQQACYARIYESDTLIPSELRENLIRSISVLENVPEDKKDWHPRSDGLVLDLVHPSMYCTAYGKTMAYTSRSDPSDSKDAALEPLEPPDDDEPWSISHRFSWIPTDFKIQSRTSAKAQGYINNLHPSHTDLKAGIEQVVARFSALFDRVLTDCIPVNSMPLRIDPNINGYSWVEKMPEPHWLVNEDTEETWTRRYDEWKASRTLTMPTVQKDKPPYDISARHDYYSIVGKKAQVIVKLASIHLTPEKPEYGGGSWHVEGMANERIVASGIYYYDCENITDSYLSFRMAINFGEESYEQDDQAATTKVWGLNRSMSSNQVLGRVQTKEGRCIAFPNIYQHQVSPFRLIDATKPGHRKIIALFLVDPGHRIPSTSVIPPQQAEWARQAMDAVPVSASLHKMPTEILDMVTRNTETLMTEAEAKAYREELMDERTAFVGEQNENYFATEFNMCEH